MYLALDRLTRSFLRGAALAALVTAHAHGHGTTGPVTPDPPAATPETPAATPETPESPAATPDPPAADPAGEAAAFTGIRGVVTDAKTGEPLIEATVKVIRGATRQVLTDVDGRFALRLSPGSYDLRVFYDIYQARRFGNVVVERGAATELDIQLSAAQDAVEEVVVEAKVDKRSEAALLAERKKAAVVSDSLSAQEIARSPDTNAGDAVKRVVSATVTDGRYVFVRGLGGRYSTTLLNGADLPSADPDEQAVPIDIFPTTLLSNLTVFKTYSPDLPGAFSGGALQIETNAYPTKFELRFKPSFEYNSESSFRAFNTYRGSRFDVLGVDDGTRALPAAVPGDRPVIPGTTVDNAEAERIGESFANIWNVRRRTGSPALGLSFSVGDTIGKGPRRFGYLIAGNYGYRDRVQRATVQTVNFEVDRLTVRETLDNVTSIQSASAGALINLGFGLARGHELNLLSTVTRNTDDRAVVVAGRSEVDREFIEGTRFQFAARTLSFTQLRGEHSFARGIELRWQGNFSIALRSEPDTRDIEFSVVGENRDQRRFRSEPQSGERFYSRLRDLAAGGGVHLTLPVHARVKLRVGGAYQSTSRTFSARRFRFVYEGTDPSVLFQQPPEALFTPENIGPAFTVQERTLPSDAYRALFAVGGPYALADAEVARRVRLLVGLRYEIAVQRLTPSSPFAISQAPVPGVDRRNGNFLPAASVNVTLSERMNLRVAYSYTLARPKFRELAPFSFYDFTRRRSLAGNPALRDTRIHNADVRWELFPAEGSVVALSGFYKYFADPIENVIYDPGNGDIGFDNQLGAHVAGAELELRTKLGFIAAPLRSFFVGLNGSYIFSRVRIRDSGIANTNSVRPLQGQSPFVVNLNLGWSWDRTGTELGALYNISGARISDVGYSGLPDIYEQPVHRVDAVLNQRLGRRLLLKVNVTNLANQPIRFRQGSVLTYQFRPGVGAYGALEWAF